MSQNHLSHRERWSAVKYGSRRGMLTTVQHQLYGLFGSYRQYKAIRWADVNRLVFVCKGNICRSAYAEVLARQAGLEAISFGLQTVDNAPANKDAIRIASELDIDLKQHLTTTVTNVELKPGDLLVAMEPWQLKELTGLFADRYQYTLLGLWIKPELPHLQDPYAMSDAYFKTCFQHIRRAINTLSGKIKQ